MSNLKDAFIILAAAMLGVAIASGLGVPTGVFIKLVALIGFGSFCVVVVGRLAVLKYRSTRQS